MNRRNFIDIIEANGPADRETVGELSEILGIFPYFQSAHVLLLKGMSNTSDVRFENQLKSSAMHIADRTALYYFLQSEAKELVKVENENITQPQTDSAEEHDQTVIEAAMNSSDLISAIEKEQIPSEMAEEEQPMVNAGIQHEIIKEELETESSASILILDSETGEVEQKIIYMDPGFSSDKETDLLEIEAENVQSVTEENNKADIRLSVPEAPKTQSELIEQFILANPRIEPVRVRPDEPVVDIAKPFTEHQDGFVTETLAKIYINQGYFSRAIDIYEKLSLKFSEKSSYFASQIEKVKELIKN